jgi:hypothetical protein
LELGGVLVAVARALRTSAEDAHGGPVRIEHVHGRPEVVEYERRLPVRVRSACDALSCCSVLRRVPSACQARVAYSSATRFQALRLAEQPAGATWLGSSSADVRYIPELPLRTAASAIRNVLGFSTSRST